MIYIIAFKHCCVSLLIVFFLIHFSLDGVYLNLIIMKRTL